MNGRNFCLRLCLYGAVQCRLPTLLLPPPLVWRRTDSNLSVEGERSFLRPTAAAEDPTNEREFSFEGERQCGMTCHFGQASNDRQGVKRNGFPVTRKRNPINNCAHFVALRRWISGRTVFLECLRGLKLRVKFACQSNEPKLS